MSNANLAESPCCAFYVSPEFGEQLTVERRMPKTVDVKLWSKREGVRWHRWRRADLAAYLKALGFHRHNKR